MANITDVYTSYHAMSAEITEGLSQMAKICEKLDLKERAESLMESRRKLQEHRFSVGILGEFKRGKSTVINALLGQEIMPADITPCSATMNRVTYDLTPRAQVNMCDGSHVDIAVEDLAKYVTKLDEDAIAMSEKVEEAIVYYPCRFCQNGVDIVDTPGLNDDERMNKITENIVPKLDAVIMVLVADNPFSISEAEFVRNKLMCSDVGRLIFLVNKIDTVRPKDRDKAINGIREKIKKTVLDKTEDVYGKESDQYRMVQTKLADIRIFPISAINALDGRIEGDTELLKKSGMLKFEAALSYMLTAERGILELSGPMIKLVNIGQALSEVIGQKRNAMELDEQTFLEAQQATVREIKKLGDQKKAEKENLKLQATSVQRDLTQKAQECYQAIETDVGKIIDDMEPRGRMDTSDKQALIQETVGKIEEKIRDRMHIFAERIISELNTSIQQEREKLSFELVGQGLDRINAPLNNIKLNDSKMSAGASVVPIVTDTMLATFTPVFGIGGAIEGFRAAGLKGGIAGGLSGCAISYAGLVLAATLGAAALPAVVLGAAAGAFGGKAVTKALFKDEIARKSLEALQKDLRQQVSASLTQMRLSAKLETWIRNEVSSRYGDLIRTMENECDSIIAETNRKILAISQTLTASEAERKAQRQDLTNLEEEAAALMKNLEPVYRKILAVPEPTAV